MKSRKPRAPDKKIAPRQGGARKGRNSSNHHSPAPGSRQARPIEYHGGIPILDAVVYARIRSNPRAVMLETVRCPFCGDRHVHGGEPADIAIGTLVRRGAHCSSFDAYGRRVTTRPENGYYLRIIVNPFLKEKT